MFLDIPDIIFGDWWSVQAAVNQIRFRLGTDASPTYTGITLTGLTASRLVASDASKALESVTIGTGLDYTRPTLSLSHLGIEDLTDPGSDKILFWDDSETATGWLGVGNSIAITTTTLDTIQDIRTTASPTFADLTLSSPSNIYALSHDSFADSHNLTTDIDHNTLTNTHNLTTDIDHDQLTNFTADEHFTQASITTVGTIATGTWNGTIIAIANGGTGQTTQQAAIDALTNVSGATNEHVLTKDTSTGNAIFKAVSGGQTACCRATMSGDQTIPDSTWTKLALDQTDYDTETAMDTTNNKYVVPSAGKWLICGGAAISSLVDGNKISFKIQVNGSDAGGYTSFTSGGNGTIGVTGQDILDLSVDDEVTILIWHNYGDDRTAPAYAHTNCLAIHRLS